MSASEAARAIAPGSTPAVRGRPRAHRPRSVRRDVVLVVVGAGGSYTPELVSGLAGGPGVDLPVGQIRLVDIDQERLGIMAGLTERMLAAADRPI